jgi:hypothetical protein
MSIAPLVLAAEIAAAWSEIQQYHSDLPDLAAPESLIGETSSACGMGLDFERVLHEAAHAMAAARGVRDTSRGGRYHNGRFLEIAEELGMRYGPVGPALGGFSAVTMRPTTRKLYHSGITRLENAVTSAQETTGSGDPQIFTGPTKRRTPPGGGVRTKATCACGRSLYVVPSVLRKAPIICSACGHEFRPGR